MTDIRALIRDLLSEEIAALRAEILGGAQAERVSVGNEAELTAFALNIARRAQEPGFTAALEAGRIRYAPAQTAAPVPAPAPAPRPSAPVALTATAPPSVPELRKGLITERDIAAVPEGEPRLRITKTARLTPLAGDEARRRGIRIERTLA